MGTVGKPFKIGLAKLGQDVCSKGGRRYEI